MAIKTASMRVNSSFEHRKTTRWSRYRIKKTNEICANRRFNRRVIWIIMLPQHKSAAY